jgi:arylsulfatase A-like enzyme
VTDYLSVSFSSTDYVGHLFGPSSLEAEDNLLRLDRTLADLFAFVDDRIGLENALVVLSADHGGPEAPAQLNQYGLEAGHVAPDRWDKEAGIASLKQRFGIGGELIDEFFPPYVYLNRDVIRDRGLNQGELERAVAEEMLKLEGVAHAVSSTSLIEGRAPDTAVIRTILNNHNPGRSGDIFVVFDGLEVAATHGSPWGYDTHVPVIFAGAGLKPQRIYREVKTVDVAPTLAALVSAKQPSGTSGNVLDEVVNPR